MHFYIKAKRIKPKKCQSSQMNDKFIRFCRILKDISSATSQKMLFTRKHLGNPASN